MLDYHTALDLLLNAQSHAVAVQNTPILSAANHILAQDIKAHHNMPLFDNSAMDGYAIAGFDQSHWQIIARITAGDMAEQIHLQPGQAVRIFTGAPLPKGTDAVLMQEDTLVDQQQLRMTKTIKPHQNMRFCGEEFQQGAVILSANTQLSPAAIGLIASQGIQTVPTLSPITITVFSCGNELLDVGQIQKSGKIYDANRYVLLSSLNLPYFKLIDGGILPDNPHEIRSALESAAVKSDVIITSGGASVGEEDYLKQILDQIGKITHWKLAIKPGKPFAWGKINQTDMFMLPGNPAATFVTLNQLLIPALKVRAGLGINQAMPRKIIAKATFSDATQQSRRQFLRAKLFQKNNQYHVDVLPNQSSSMLSACVEANALLEIPPNTLIENDQCLCVYPLYNI